MASKSIAITSVVRRLIATAADGTRTEYHPDGKPVGPLAEPLEVTKEKPARKPATRKSASKSDKENTTMTRKNTAQNTTKKAATKKAVAQKPARTYNNDKTLKVVAGNLGKDPQHVITQSGKLFVYFPLAVNGEEGATWYQINAWEGLGKRALKWLRKGRFIKVEGRYSEETFKGQDGKKHTVKKIVASSIRFLDDKVPEEA